MAKALQTLKSIVMAKFYAVKRGRVPGVYDNWPAAQEMIKGVPAEHKSFKTRAEALAWISATPYHSITPANAAPSTSTNPLKRSSDSRDPPAKRVAAAAPVGRKVYCDGSALGNGKASSTAGIGVYWPDSFAAPNLSERLPGLLQTNNRAEMFALARILETDPSPELPLVICSDSQYTISVFSSWIDKWQRNGWKTGIDNQPVKNKDLICFVLSLIALRPRSGSSSASGLGPSNVSFLKVKAHDGIRGNERADQLAKEGALKPAVVEREYERDTRSNERRKLERDRAARLHEQEGVAPQKMVLSFQIEYDESDFLTAAELRQMEVDQAFD